MTDPNPDAEKAALAEALESASMDGHAYLSDHRQFPRTKHEGGFSECPVLPCVRRRDLLADLSPAAKALVEKAQAHDAMEAELEDAHEELGRLRGILTDARLEVIAAGDPNIEVAHLADLEIRHRAALAGKESE